MHVISSAADELYREGDIRTSRVGCYMADLGYVFERARVGGLDGELLAQRLEALLGG